MNSLTTHYRRSQLIALPVPGGKAKVEYCYAVNVPGDREIVTHSFAEWAVGDFNRQKETVLCDKLTAGSKITTECPSESFVGSRKHNGLSTSVKAMSMSASARSNSFVVNSGKYRSVNAAVEHLRALEKKGVITIKRGVARGITLHTAVKDDDSEAVGIIRALLAGEENARLRATHWLHERDLKV